MLLIFALMVLPAGADMYLNSGVPRVPERSLHLDAGINWPLCGPGG